MVAGMAKITDTHAHPIGPTDMLSHPISYPVCVRCKHPHYHTAISPGWKLYNCVHCGVVMCGLCLRWHLQHVMALDLTSKEIDPLALGKRDVEQQPGNTPARSWSVSRLLFHVMLTQSRQVDFFCTEETATLWLMHYFDRTLTPGSF